jgi:hypothetical protein
MVCVVITLTPEIFDFNPVVHGPFETWDEAEEFLDRWINAHPGTRGAVRLLPRPFEPPKSYFRQGKDPDWPKPVIP